MSIDINWWIMGLAVFYSIHSTFYFGSNWLPASDAEVITDGITLLLFAMSVFKS